ncbi:hypothetical protein DYB28_001588 [Aphanomyces astaci]|uniref:NAD(P)-binding domain-containing protein n=1 Tax=Aphanomyces astaci TaxID=112090 RepID=A0A397AAR6_APHAT|nr:hypothetical protein DYB36_008197 [Aphanomyces astaci]RHY72222.1 hypothetical protein DYB38_001827 [Aphanomyces astaci]RHZ24678.1 hypothetical protein DYB26_002224 [Aphanomyces astaci]RLO03716.1 hypothetical protein DYB28_001588 [Aphanomyces astaci]
MLQRYPSYKVVVYDKLTYAGNLGNLHDICDDPRLMFVQGDICDATCVDAAILDHGVDTIVNFAAETHVDRSILNPDAFIHTNVLGTATLLDSARRHAIRRFHQISTDEVYGQVQAERSSVETDRLDPRSPYAASKASADLLVVSYFVTFGLPTTITRASNNVGPYQYPEKVVPLFTTNAMDDLSLPVYGDGLQQREYQYVADHSEAVDVVLHHGVVGEIYNVGTGSNPMTNMAMAELVLESVNKPTDLIQHVQDRPGHDLCYRLNIDKLRRLGWQPSHSPREAVSKSVRWYVENEWWWRQVKRSDAFQRFYKDQYGHRMIQSAE